jgi:hypothetical protein
VTLPTLVPHGGFRDRGQTPRDVERKPRKLTIQHGVSQRGFMSPCHRGSSSTSKRPPRARASA